MAMTLQYAYHGQDFAYQFPLPLDGSRDLPLWLEDEPFPPLSPRAAIEISCAVVKRLLADDVGPFEPELVHCEMVQNASGQGYHHVVWEVPGLPGRAGGTFGIPVLFDGSTPTPVKATYEQRFELYRRPLR